MSDTAVNRRRQAELYGEPLGDLVARTAVQLGLTQARIAAALGVSAPMLSQLMSGQRIKLGNPLAVQRLQTLVQLGGNVAAGLVPAAEVPAQLADIASQTAPLTETTTTTRGRVSAAAAVRTVQSLIRSVAGADEVAAAAHLLDTNHPELAGFLRAYGVGRTADAIDHYEAHRHLM
ncbi:MAG: hypothetical protein ACRDUA_12440 [Micromonosporaceae bacterium]